MSFVSKLKINPDNLKYRQLNWRGYDFEIRVPLKKELAQLHSQADAVDELAIANKLNELREQFKEQVYTQDDGNFYVQEGQERRNLNEIAKDMIRSQKTIMVFVGLIKLPEGQESLTITDLEEDMNLEDQIDLMTAISKTISGRYEDERKNS